jgi:hypothetical protein
MMKRFFFLVVLSAMVGAFLITGCTKESGPVTSDEAGLNFEDEFGGYDASNEAPGFGDEIILSEMSEETEIAVDDPEFANQFATLDTLPIVRVHAMKILWGMLEFDSTVTEVTDWSGSLTIEHGAIKIASLIRFERPVDHIMRPRTDCSKLEWVSYTAPHFDGILVWLYDLSDSMGLTANSVTFETGPYSRTFDISELDSLSEIIEVDEFGNKVSFEARYMPTPDCEYGFLDGRWVIKDDDRGVFFGRWVNWSGMAMGHLRGHWGIDNAGEKVFFGKWIGCGGEFRGLLRGTWDYGVEACVDCPPAGTFRGTWADRNRVVKGGLGGRWVSCLRSRDDSTGNTDNGGNGNGNMGGMNNEIGGIPDRHCGFLHGRWNKFYPEVE